MKAHTLWVCRSVAALAVAAAIPFSSFAAKNSIIPLVANVFTSVYDEQTGVGCQYPGDMGASGLRPDRIPGATFAWDFYTSPWTATTGLSSGLYENGTFPVSTSSFLRVEFNTNNKNFLIDTRTTAGPTRGFNMDFSQPWNLATGQPGTNVPPWGTALATPGLFEVLGASSLTQMAVCSTTACPESMNIRAKFWFADPSAADVMWRIDWAFIRVLRVSTGAWYFIADACDGSQVAGLSELIGNRTKPREVNSGNYLIPLFITATLRQ